MRTRTIEAPKRNRPRLTRTLILRWADHHHRRTGKWPKEYSGPVLAAPEQTWNAVAVALYSGCRGLPGGTTLPRLLAKRRGVRHHLMAKRLTHDEILRWADRHKARTGSWPSQHSGPVLGVPGEKWVNVHAAMLKGGRGLPRGCSLGQLLRDRRGVRNVADLSRLTKKQILAWADLHFERAGRWPTETSGKVRGALEGESWYGVNQALLKGKRGLPAGDSLVRMLQRERGRRNVAALPRLTHGVILRWADVHRQYMHRWPNQNSGAVLGAPGETWRSVHLALWRGSRGLPARVTLAQLLKTHRGKRRRHSSRYPLLTTKQIIAWARAFRRRTDRWPTRTDKHGPPEAPREKWVNLTNALYVGLRGLPGGSSLYRLLRHVRP